jgi:hypothetical protein
MKVEETELEAYVELQRLLVVACFRVAAAEKKHDHLPIPGLVFDDVAGQLLDLISDLDVTIRHLKRQEE